MQEAEPMTPEFLDEFLRDAGCDATAQPRAHAQSSGNGHSGPPFDMPAFLARHGLRVRTIKQDGSYGTKYVLEECPFDASHKAPDSYVAVMPSGALCFKCSHNSCSSHKWRELRDRLEPGYRDRAKPQAGQQERRQDQPTGKQPESVTYQRITAAELDTEVYSIEYDIDDLHVVGQPQITAAEKKALKTTLAIEASISQASGLPCLGKFNVSRKTRVLMMSGESGLGTIQETAKRICRNKGLELADLKDGWILSPDVPQLDDVRHHVALEDMLRGDGIETLYIDPTYLCIPGDDAGNLIKQGRLLRIVGNICQRLGVSLTMLHHTKKSVDDPFRPAELADISWSGFAEWARQWWLISRRVRYDADRPGHHELWLNVGGSAGHSSLWALNIDEGSPKDVGGRMWQVEVKCAKDARAEAQEQQQAQKVSDKQAKQAVEIEAAKQAIADALRGVDGHQDTERNIKLRAGMDGAAFNKALAYLLRVGKLVEVQIKRGNNHEYPGFKYTIDDKQT